MIILTDQAIDVPAVLQAVQSPRAGAVVLFLGTTREFTRGRQTRWLAYEAYREMAETKLSELVAAAVEKWSLEQCVIAHRLGRVDVGETSVAVAVSSSHRAPAFEAGQWLIDTLKEVVPIWKQEHYADGDVEWIHPGLTAGADYSRPMAESRIAPGAEVDT